MEQLVIFNGVKILLTTGKSIDDVQSLELLCQADLVLSVSPKDLRVLKDRYTLRVTERFIHVS